MQFQWTFSFYYYYHRCYCPCRCFDFFLSFFLINASGTAVEYNKSENKENKNEIDIIYYNHRFLARLMLSMRATFKKWLINDVRIFVEFASLKMWSIFNEQTRINVRFDFFKTANVIMSLYHHFDNNIVVFL